MAVDQDVKDAAALLVTGENAEQLFRTLEATVRKAAGLPVKLTGEFASVNPLLRLSQTDYPTYEVIIKWVFSKRKASGLEPLKDEQSDLRREYMREFMAAKRVRERRAVDIENMLRSESDKLVGTARMEFVRRQSAAWKLQRDKLLEAERMALGGGRLPTEVYSSTLQGFWADVDRQLDEMEALTLDELRKPLTQRKRLSPQMQALQDALRE